MPQRTYGKLSSNILSSVFELSNARSQTVQSMIDSAYLAIKDRNEDQYVDYLSKLTKILGSDDLDITGLKIEKMRRDRMLAK